MRTRIGIAGLGTVGAEVARQLLAAEKSVGAPALSSLVLTGVAVRDVGRNRGIDLSAVTVGTDPVALASSDSIDVFVELMGGLELARTAIVAALKTGKHVVTANKQLIAAYGDELTALAREHGQWLRYSAAVAGGAPVIEALTGSHHGEEVTEIAGILNGTTSFILDALANGDDYASALMEAQRLGWAESDPSEDVGGADAAAKLAICATVVWEHPFTVADVQTCGITEVASLDVGYARELDLAMVLLARAQRDHDGVWLSVAPTLIPQRGHTLSPLASLPAGGSGVVITGSLNESVAITGTGAGAKPTASALLSDIVAVTTQPLPQDRDREGQRQQLRRGVPGDRETGAYLRLAHTDIDSASDVISLFLEDRGVPVAMVSDVDANNLVLVTRAATAVVISNALETLDSLGSITVLARHEAVI